MMMKLKWRLSKLPTVEELTSLIEKKVLTAEDAKQILVTNETTEEVDKKSLESEIKFLRELVERLSDRSQIISTIHTVQPTYIKQPWYHYYGSWCGGLTNTFVGGEATTVLCGADNNTSAGISSLNCDFNSTTAGNFSDIKTF